MTRVKAKPSTLHERVAGAQCEKVCPSNPTAAAYQVQAAFEIVAGLSARDPSRDTLALSARDVMKQLEERKP